MLNTAVNAVKLFYMMFRYRFQLGPKPFNPSIHILSGVPGSTYSAFLLYISVQ